MIPEEAWSLIPDTDPSEELDWARNVARQAEFPERQYRSYLWAMALRSNLTGQAISTAITGVLVGSEAWRPGRAFPVVTDISAGFIPYERKRGDAPVSMRALRLLKSEHSIAVGERRFAFGLVIGISLRGLDEDEVSAFEQSLDQPPSQVVDILKFPVVVEIRRQVLNAPPNPQGVSSACYVRPRKSKVFYGPHFSNGILIARHVLSSLGVAYGTLVPMSSGAQMQLVDVDQFATTIDAAILDCGTIPAASAPLALAAAVAPGTKVTVRALASAFSTDVLRISDHPSYFGNMVAHRCFTDNYGVSGDSGSLVSTHALQQAVGVYMGSTPPGPSAEGIVQSMRQVVAYFDVDLYD